VTDPHTQRQRTFRPDPGEYAAAQAHLAARGRHVGDFLRACLRWINRDPDAALATLQPLWPDPRPPGRPFNTVAYALRDGQGRWHGEPDLLPAGRYRDVPTPRPFEPADPANPLAGERFTVRCGELADDDRVSLYTLRVVAEDGREVALRITHAVQDALFGPPITGTPERDQWEAARDRKQRQLDQH
jgi:hypothetical protein